MISSQRVLILTVQPNLDLPLLNQVEGKNISHPVSMHQKTPNGEEEEGGTGREELSSGGEGEVKGDHSSPAQRQAGKQSRQQRGM